MKTPGLKYVLVLAALLTAYVLILRPEIQQPIPIRSDGEAAYLSALPVVQKRVHPKAEFSWLHHAPDTGWRQVGPGKFEVFGTYLEPDCSQRDNWSATLEAEGLKWIVLEMRIGSQIIHQEQRVVHPSMVQETNRSLQEPPR